MAVNDNDRVTSRRLKQFWDLLAIGTEKIKDAAVTSDKIKNSAITENKLDSSSVTGNKISNDAVSTNKLQSLVRRTLPYASNTTKRVTGSAKSCYFSVLYQKPSASYCSVCGFIAEGFYSDLLDNASYHISERQEEGTITGFNISPSTFNLSITFGGGEWPDLIGECSLQTDNGLYTTPIKMKRNGSNNCFITYLDPTFYTHLSEQNAYLIAHVAFYPTYSA